MKTLKTISYINGNKGKITVNMVGFIMLHMVVHITVYGSVGDAALFTAIPGTSFSVSLHIPPFTSAYAVLFDGLFTVIVGGLFLVFCSGIYKVSDVFGGGGDKGYDGGRRGYDSGPYDRGSGVYGYGVYDTGYIGGCFRELREGCDKLFTGQYNK